MLIFEELCKKNCWLLILKFEKVYIFSIRDDAASAGGREGEDSDKPQDGDDV